jgi:hypothetical protein
VDGCSSTRRATRGPCWFCWPPPWPAGWQNGLNDKARTRLQNLIKNYPDTKAAAEAKELLKDMPE